MKRRVLAWILAAAMTATSVPSNAFTAFAGEAADEAATEVTAAVDAGGSAEEAAADAGGSRELAGANGGESADDTAYEEEAPDQIDLVDALSGEAADEDSDIVLEDETPDGTITDLDQESSADADDGILIEEADEELPTASEAVRNLADSNNTYATVDLNLPDQVPDLIAGVDDKTSALQEVTADVTFAGDSAPDPQTDIYAGSYIHASNADYLYWYAVTGFDSTGNPENLTNDGTLTSGTWYLVPVKRVYDNYYNLTYQFFPKKGKEEGFVFDNAKKTASITFPMGFGVPDHLSPA